MWGNGGSFIQCKHFNHFFLFFYYLHPQKYDVGGISMKYKPRMLTMDEMKSTIIRLCIYYDEVTESTIYLNKNPTPL